MKAMSIKDIENKIAKLKKKNRHRMYESQIIELEAWLKYQKGCEEREKVSDYIHEPDPMERGSNQFPWFVRRNEEGQVQISFIDDNHVTTIIVGEISILDLLIQEIKAFKSWDKK